MPSQDQVKRMTEEGRGLNCDDFVRMFEGGRPIRARDLISIKDLAVELGVAVRTLRRWNKLPDAPQRFKQSRRLMYRRADVQHWFERSKDVSGGGDARDEGAA